MSGHETMGTDGMSARKKRCPALSHHLRPASMTTGCAGAQRCKRRNLCVIRPKRLFRRLPVPLSLDIAALAMVGTGPNMDRFGFEAAAPQRLAGRACKRRCLWAD